MGTANHIHYPLQPYYYYGNVSINHRQIFLLVAATAAADGMPTITACPVITAPETVATDPPNHTERYICSYGNECKHDETLAGPNIWTVNQCRTCKQFKFIMFVRLKDSCCCATSIGCNL